MANIGKECPECGKNGVFFNAAGGLTCEKCGQIFMSIDGEHHYILRIMIKKQEELIASNANIIRIYEKHIK